MLTYQVLKKMESVWASEFDLSMILILRFCRVTRQQRLVLNVDG